MRLTWQTLVGAALVVTACGLGRSGCGVMDDPLADSDVVALNTVFRRHQQPPLVNPAPAPKPAAVRVTERVEP